MILLYLFIIGGEPLLNPNFYEIVESIKNFGMRVGMSTNCSKIIENKTSFAHLNHLFISMPGFSQSSYDRIHGFNFKKIKSNIERTIENLKSAVANPSIITICVHKYKFNENEIPLVQNFAQKLGIGCAVAYAYFNSFDFFEQYLEGWLPHKYIKKSKRRIIFSRYSKTIS